MSAQRSFDCFFLIVTWLLTATTTCICDGEDKPSFNLPEKFSNDKLPNQDKPTVSQICYKYLDCFNKIPIDKVAQDPRKLKTEFKITNGRNQDVIIPFEEKIACDSKRCDLYPYDLGLISKIKFDPHARTIIISPGYQSSRFADWQESIKDSWLKLEKVNVIVVSWSGGNAGLYNAAVANSWTVARQITVLLYYLAKLANCDLTDRWFSEKIYLVGHSLGAHISSYVGDDFAGQIGRITGLDPAGPQFSSFSNQFKLDKSDARLVDTLHTNGGDLSTTHFAFGLDQPVGHVDLYVNNGRHQPQCQSDMLGCSHQLAYELYNIFLQYHLTMLENLIDISSEKFQNHRMFAYRSNNYEDFQDGKSLATFCPSSVINDIDFDQVDMMNCLIPIDYVADAAQVRQELKKYRIDFRSDEPPSNRFFFLTNSIQPYLSNHYLIKIKSASLTKEAYEMIKDRASAKCNLLLHVSMSDGSSMEIGPQGFELVNNSELKDILVPYLARDNQNKLNLAKLDAGDFLHNDTISLQWTLKELLPASLRFTTKAEKAVPKYKDNYHSLESILDEFFKLAQGKTDHCAFNVDRVSIQPLRKLHRRLIASYSISVENKKNPIVIVTQNVEEYLQVVKDLWNNEDHSSEKFFVSGWAQNELYLNTVILGPYDNNID